MLRFALNNATKMAAIALDSNLRSRQIAQADDNAESINREHRPERESEPANAIVFATQQSLPITPLETIQTSVDRHPDATEISPPLLLPEVDRMPSTTANAEVSTRSELILSTKRHADFDTEERLLGSSGRNNDAGAVRIGMPQTRLSAAKIPSGGPRPKNTLQGSPQTTRASQAAKSRSRGIQNQLATVPSRGSNVKEMPHATDQDYNFVIPSAKRQKTRHHPSSPESSPSIDDAMDGLDPRSISFGAISQSRSGSRAPSAQSQGSGRQMTRSTSSNGSLQEYKNLERLMSSDPRSTKLQRRQNSQNQQQSHGLPASSSISDSIDISGDEDVIKTDPLPPAFSRLPHRGTMMKYPSTAQPNTSKAIQTRKQSRFFTRTGLLNGSGKQKLSSAMAGDEAEDRLADIFVQVDGRRRRSDVNMSSDVDELSKGGDTVRHLADTSTSRSRQNSPSKPSLSTKLASPTGLSEGLAESNIKPSLFVSSNSKGQSDSRLMNGRLREKKPSWAIEIAAISYAGAVIKDAGMGLFYNETSKIYIVVRDGKPLPLQIRPEKLLNISWGTAGGKARFVSSKSGTDDNMLDIEFRNEKDLSELVKRLEAQSGSKTKPRDSDYMDRIFERRRQELQRSFKTLGSSALKPDDSQDGTNAWQRHRSGQSSPPVSAETHRQRTGRTLVSELYGRAAQEDVAKSTVQDTKPKPNSKEKTVREILGGLMKPQAHNSHLRRSTRTSSTTSKGSIDIDDFAHLEDISTEDKYSKLYGLGKPWNKPLTYPREGKKKTTVEFSDLERLDEGEFLNDNLISFYLRFLEQDLHEHRPDIAKRVYFFNTFFFATLTNTHKGRKSFNYDGVQKWTRAVDLFTYDYIVVPINESSHWYLAIICNLPALDRSLQLAEEFISSQTEATSTITPNKSHKLQPPSSSPAAQDGAQDGSTNLVEDAENETEARNSFAEMSLANDAEVHAQATDQQDEDQEMLDAQFEDAMPGSVALRTAVIHSAAKAAWLSHSAEDKVQDAGDLLEDLEDRPKASTAKSKKQKRKSILPSITKIDPSKPAIILFDSLGLSRGSTIKILKDYLHEEARTKRGGMEFDGGQIKGINAKVPQQRNFSDCGLYLLGYVAKFLEDNPRDFITKIIRREFDETKDWSRLVPSTLRANIRDQVQELHKIQEGKRQSAKKAGQFQDKKGQKLDSSPTRASIGQAKIPDQETVKAEIEAPRNLAEQTSLGIGQGEPESMLDCPTYNFDKEKARIKFQSYAIDDKQAKKTMGETDRAIEAVAAIVSPTRTVDVNKAVAQGQKQEPKASDVENIVIDSQSQNGASARKSLEPGNRASRPSSRLPSEVPDSQPSTPAKAAAQDPSERSASNSVSPQRSEAMKSFQKVLHNQPLKAITTLANDSNGQEAHKVAVEIPAERLRKQYDRARRQKSLKKPLEDDDVQVIDVIDVDD